jgi:hypothetical protein
MMQFAVAPSGGSTIRFSSLGEIMQFPACPVCNQGHMLPFSDEHKPFAFWICSMSDCGYSIGRNMTSETYYKGTAASEDKSSGQKKWTEYNF